jgi:nonsense-mediated mRNA decay protein 3
MGFCPRCGTQTDYKLCLDCLREHHPLIEKIGPVQATLCPSCGKTQVKAIWTKKGIQEGIEKALERAITFSPHVRIDGVIVEPVAPEPGKQVLQLTVMGSADVEEEGYDEYYEVTTLIHGILCTECQQLKNKYYTGIIQLRRPTEANEEVQYEIERLLGKALTSVKDVTGGIDYYVSDHRILQNVARAVHDDFGGELTVRAQHFSYDSLTSKNLYRVNACLRLPKYWKGSVIRAGNKLFLITNMGRSLKGIDLATGKKTSVPCHLEYQEVPLVETTVVTTQPTVTVLDPETYQTVPLRNEKAVPHTLEPGARILLCVDDVRYYFVREVE